MTVIENLNPKVQYTYTVGHQFYTITFPYIEREYVKVMVRDQLLTYNVHYGVPSFDAESLDTNQLQIELYITPEEELDDDITIEAGDTITIYRATPLDQQQEFPQNAKFSSQKITEALDKLTHQQQGYTDWTQFYALVMPTMREDGRILYHPAAFSLKTADADYRVELWSKEGGNAIYRMDTNLWTICISVDRFTVINQTTQQQRNQELPETVTLYYSAKSRIE